MCKLSKADIVKFHELMGRSVPPELYTPDIVTLMLTEARRDAKVAEPKAARSPTACRNSARAMLRRPTTIFAAAANQFPLCGDCGEPTASIDCI